jgi:hypothetical protein
MVRRRFSQEVSLGYDGTKVSRLRDTLEQMLKAFMKAADR